MLTKKADQPNGPKPFRYFWQHLTTRPIGWQAVASAALPKDKLASDVSSIGELGDNPVKYTPP
jgi:hypothetical protein